MNQPRKQRSRRERLSQQEGGRVGVRLWRVGDVEHGLDVLIRVSPRGGLACKDVPGREQLQEGTKAWIHIALGECGVVVRSWAGQGGGGWRAQQDQGVGALCSWSTQSRLWSSPEDPPLMPPRAGRLRGHVTPVRKSRGDKRQHVTMGLERDGLRAGGGRGAGHGWGLVEVAPTGWSRCSVLGEGRQEEGRQVQEGGSASTFGHASLALFLGVQPMSRSGRTTWRRLPGGVELRIEVTSSTGSRSGSLKRRHVFQVVRFLWSWVCFLPQCIPSKLIAQQRDSKWPAVFPRGTPGDRTGASGLISPVHLWKVGSVKCSPREVRELETHIPLFNKSAGLQPWGDAE